MTFQKLAIISTHGQQQQNFTSQDSFFWNSGSIEQRSLARLLRCLLYEVLVKRSYLIWEVFPEEWAENRSLIVKTEDLIWRWLFAMLKTAFIRLTKFATDWLKMCFFIDGLDECEEDSEGGDHESMCELLNTISASPFIKICLSSRPWLVFEEALKHCSGLRLQDLTYGDI